MKVGLSDCLQVQKQSAHGEIARTLTMAKVITVFGSTGQQGGAVLHGLLSKTDFKVRGVTRDPGSAKAQKLSELDRVEIVQASLDDEAAISAAVSGAYGVFLVTNYWEHQDKDREIRQGKFVADACKKAGVKHVVFSGLESVTDAIGKSCPHFDGKAEVEKYMDSIGLPNTSVRYAFYCENFVSPAFGFQKQPDGSYGFVHCMVGPMDVVSVEQCGPAVASIFCQPEEFIGKKIGFSGDKMTMQEMADIVANATGKTINVFQKSPDEYAKMGFPGAEDLAAMFDFYAVGNPDRDIALTKQLNPSLSSFQEWVDANKENFFTD